MQQSELEAKLKDLSAEFELFAHITSHDLRDPLRQAVINCDELQKENSNNNLIAETKDAINEVISRIALLREYSYLANSDKEFKDVDCNKSLQDALEKLRDKIASSNAEITCDKLPVIKGHEPYITRLFTELIDNAIKFRGADKPKIHIGVTENADNYEFSISDNGIGLEEVYRELVFALFQRLDPETKDGSFGAGLAFCKKIATLHHGRIWFKSDGENGTVFYFSVSK